MTVRDLIDGLSRRLQDVLQDRAMMRKAISFASIGFVNATIDFCVFTFAHYYLEWPIIVANPTGWIIAVTNSYVMNSMFTFAAESGRKLRLKDYVAFAATQFGGLIANTATVYAASFFVPTWMAKIPALGVSFLVDFSLSNFVVFRRRGTSPHS
jgi:putative flippase GtrA